MKVFFEKKKSNQLQHEFQDMDQVKGYQLLFLFDKMQAQGGIYLNKFHHQIHKLVYILLHKRYYKQLILFLFFKKINLIRRNNKIIR